MKKILIVVFTVILINLFGAEFVVTEFKEEPMSIELQRNPVKDINGEYAALIKISTDLQPFSFQTNIGVVETDIKVGEFWGYVSAGTSQLIFTKTGFNKYRYSIPVSIKGNSVYNLTLSSKGYSADIADEDLIQVTLSLNLEGIYIGLDSSVPLEQPEKVAVYKVPKGEHTFKFMKSGYEDIIYPINVNEDKILSIEMVEGKSVSTLKLPGFIDITSNPVGADIFINDQKFGVTPAQIELTAGEHTLKLRKNLYHTYIGSFNLEEKEAKRLESIDLEPKHGYLNVTSEFLEVDIYLDDKLIGKAPLSEYILGSGYHLIRLDNPLYHSYQEEFSLADLEVKNIKADLKPAFGRLVVDSTPVSGAEVWLDDKLIGLTPLTREKVPSGKQYNLKITKKLWLGAEETIVIQDEKTTHKRLLLTRNFAQLNVSSADAKIYLDGKRIGSSSIEKQLETGQYLVRAEKDRYHPREETVSITPGNDVDLNLDLEPMLGSLSIQSEPDKSQGAEIWLNGNKQEEITPGAMVLLVGEYNVTVKHEDFLTQTKMINLAEKEQRNLVFQMETYEGSLLSQSDKWKTSKWISLASTVLCVGGGFLCNSLGDAAFDDYEQATSTSSAVSYRKDMEGWYDKRDLSYSISIVPAAWFIYSWVKEADYKRKAKRGVENRKQ